MAVLNLRNVPDELMVRLRVVAARRQMKLHACCLDLLEQALATDDLFREVKLRAGIDQPVVPRENSVEVHIT